ncbi:hypothetical protein KHA80_22485 [Anaerobacillus sp. HL2]|nr:hypothetical protein KHA80_22485 [Anaerobacillus sp. HL2]
MDYERISSKYPKQWAKEKENWDEIFAAINVEYDININIARQGMSNPQLEFLKKN